jgi:hypothetical protein
LRGTWMMPLTLEADSTNVINGGRMLPMPSILI